MKTTIVSEILDKEQTANKAVIPKIQGKLTKLFDAKTGENEHGTWSLQSAEIMDASGKITVQFSNNEQPKSARNKTVTITSVEGKRGLAGIMVDDHEYNDKKERRIKVTGAANIVYSDVEEEKPKGAQVGQSRGAGGTTAPITGNVKQSFNDIVALYKECYSKVMDMDTELAKNPQALCAAVATVFIECNKQSLSFDFQKRYAHIEIPKPPTDPSKWRECYVNSPKSEYHGKTLEQVPDARLLEWFEHYNEKESNTPFAECVYAATFERKLSKKEETPKEEQPQEEVP